MLPPDWSSLPAELAYLIPSIKAISRQRVDRLDSGALVAAMPEGLIDKRWTELRLGKVRGFRATSRWDSELSPFDATYRLSVPGGFADVSMLAAGRERSFDLAAIEPSIATIRFDTDAK